MPRQTAFERPGSAAPEPRGAAPPVRPRLNRPRHAGRDNAKLDALERITRSFRTGNLTIAAWPADRTERK
jgi:hypothetical protein